MIADIKTQKLGRFVRLSMLAYRATFAGATVPPDSFEVELERCIRAWLGVHEPKKATKRRKRLDDAEWLAELKADPYLKGVDVDAQIEACRFWCRSQVPLRVANRAAIINWLNRQGGRAAVVTPTKRPAVATEPPGWLAWMTRNYPDWARLKEGRPVVWANLRDDERLQIITLMSANPSSE